jgi:hypothetical protein
MFSLISKLAVKAIIHGMAHGFMVNRDLRVADEEMSLAMSIVEVTNLDFTITIFSASRM